MTRQKQSIINEEVNFENGVELISTTNKKGVITYANPDFCKIAGYSLDELVGQIIAL
jgi:aerotaxis receptor